MAEPIYNAQGTELQIASSPVGFLEIVRATDSGRSYLGGNETGADRELQTFFYDPAVTGSLIGGVDFDHEMLPGYACQRAQYTLVNNSPAYTAIVVLPATYTGIDGVATVAPVKGQRVQFLISMPAGDYPTFEVRSLSSGGTLLLQIGPAATASLWFAEFAWEGSGWVKCFAFKSQ